MKYFLIAGEPSGDQHGSMLMRSILQIDSRAEFRFFGGDLMAAVGGKPDMHIRNLAFMGFTQLLSRLLAIRRSFRICRTAITGFSPDLVIPIDYGGFNLRLIKWLHQNGYRSAYYITPKVWAWMPSRAKKLARYTERALCILPFETEFLRNYGVRCDYVGNPVKDYIQAVKNSDPKQTISALGLAGKPVIALLPGSRRQEISKMLPVMAGVAGEFPEYQFVIAGHENFSGQFYRKICGSTGIPVMHGKTLELLKISEAAIVTSGTATLEAGLLETRQVVCYKTAPLSFMIARLLVRVKYISLVNLILERPLVEELIQGKCNRESLKAGLERILSDTRYSAEMTKGYHELNERIGNLTASATAASIVCRMAMNP